MRIEKWVFLVSYLIYFALCILFLFHSKDAAAIDTMIFGITIASVAFAFADCLFTKFDIDKKERESIETFYRLTGYAKSFYFHKMEARYGKNVETMMSKLLDAVENNEDEVNQFFDGELPDAKKAEFLEKVKAYSNDELTKFVSSYLESDISDLKEMVKEDEDLKLCDELIAKQKRKEEVESVLASMIAALGLIALLIIVTFRIRSITLVNNVFTIAAFWIVIFTMLLKDCYKAKSIKKLQQEKRSLLHELSSYKEH